MRKGASRIVPYIQRKSLKEPSCAIFTRGGTSQERRSKAEKKRHSEPVNRKRKQRTALRSQCPEEKQTKKKGAESQAVTDPEHLADLKRRHAFGRDQ